MSGCGNCSGCSGCTGGCGGCSGCASSLELTAPEMDMLRLLGQVAFLPVARKMGDETPVCLEEDVPEKTSLILQLLEKKALISLDYRSPLKGASYEKYDACPVHGSMALTARGQRVLELLELQGFSE